MKDNDENLGLFLTTILLINKTYNYKEKLCDDVAKEFENNFKDFYKINDSKEVAYNLAKTTVDYYMDTSAIMSTYHAFEQYIKIEYGVKTKGRESLLGNLKTLCKNSYNYDINKNKYLKDVKKYNLIVNSLKHGKIKDLKEKHPEIINDDDPSTLLNNSINITKDLIDNFTVNLINFVEEINNNIKE